VLDNPLEHLDIPAMLAIFITATGTDIGKTHVTAALLRHWRQAGKQVHALKPIMSGFDPASPKGSDAGQLLDALGLPIEAKTLDAVAPWRFQAALSPDMAAAREGKAIDFSVLVDFCRKEIARTADILLIEGVGGVMAPINDQMTVLDWMAALRLPVVVIAGSYLGTISHTLTALDVLARKRIDTAALVVNESPVSPVPLTETVAAIGRYWKSAPIAGFTRNADAAAVAQLAHTLEQAMAM
jgi:dethiobiotin synthetase